MPHAEGYLGQNSFHILKITRRPPPAPGNLREVPQARVLLRILHAFIESLHKYPSAFRLNGCLWAAPGCCSDGPWRLSCSSLCGRSSYPIGRGSPAGLTASRDAGHAVVRAPARSRAPGCPCRFCLPLCGQVTHCPKTWLFMSGENGPAHPALPNTQAARSV